jgi:hypothetical protein
MDFRLRDWSLISGKVLYLFSLHKLALRSTRRPCTEGIDGSVLWGEMTRTWSWPLTPKWRLKNAVVYPSAPHTPQWSGAYKNTAIFELFRKSKPQASPVSTHSLLFVKALVQNMTLRLSEASWLSKTAVSWNMTPWCLVECVFYNILFTVRAVIRNRSRRIELWWDLKLLSSLSLSSTKPRNIDQNISAQILTFSTLTSYVEINRQAYSNIRANLDWYMKYVYKQAYRL